MKKMLLYLPLSLLLSVSMGSFAQDTRLSYNLQPQVEYLLDIDIQQNTHSESMNSEEIHLSNRMKVIFRVDSLSDSGSIHLTAHYRDLHLAMLAPALGIDINSRSGKSSMLTAMIDSLEQNTFRVTMKNSGELIAVEGFDTIFPSLAAVPVSDTNEQQVILKTLDEVYGSHSFESMFSLFVSVYPVVQPITNWTRDVMYYFNTKPVKMVNRYYHTMTKEQDIIIQGLGMLNSMKDYHEKTDMGQVRSRVSGSQTFDYQMDLQTGWLNRCVSRQRVVIETTIVNSTFLPEGLKIPSYTETTFEVEGSVLH